MLILRGQDSEIVGIKNDAKFWIIGGLKTIYLFLTQSWDEKNIFTKKFILSQVNLIDSLSASQNKCLG